MTISTETTAGLCEAVLAEVERAVVGKRPALTLILTTVLAGGHVLIEDLPGTGKTLIARSFAAALGLSFTRVQFTPDLLPSDIVGTRIYRPSGETFDVELGPVFVNLLLADEVNRAPAKVQSALLEVMAERQVSLGGTTYPVPAPFFVIATQNPLESEGVYQLPDAQRDRFMMKVVMTHPSAAEELAIVERMSVAPPRVHQVIDLEQLQEVQRCAEAVTVDRSVAQYAVDLVQATRHPVSYGLPDLASVIALGASPRATLALVRGARALALMKGRDRATIQDVFDLAPEVFRHRLLLTYDALARDLTTDHVVQRVLGSVPAGR